MPTIRARDDDAAESARLDASQEPGDTLPWGIVKLRSTEDLNHSPLLSCALWSIA